MSEKTITITEKDGRYGIQNTGLSKFETIGILECLIFDLKTASREERANIGETPLVQMQKPKTGQEKNEDVSKAAVEPVAKETVQEQSQERNSPDIRTRISNAVKAIKSLGGQASETDFSNATDEELQAELEDLKNQYKRLKSSQKPK